MPTDLLPSSFAVAHQTHEDVLEGTLTRVQVLEPDAKVIQPLEQGRDAGALLVTIESVFQLAPASLQRQSPIAQLQRNEIQRLEKIERQLLLAKLFHQLDFSFDHDQFSLVDHPDSVGHFLSLVDIVSSQDDCHAAFSQPSYQGPHLAAQFDVDAGGRLIQKENLRLLRPGLGAPNPPLPPPRSFHVSPFPL